MLALAPLAWLEPLAMALALRRARAQSAQVDEGRKAEALVRPVRAEQTDDHRHATPILMNRRGHQ
jgi:hypothetical protein